MISAVHFRTDNAGYYSLERKIHITGRLKYHCFQINSAAPNSEDFFTTACGAFSFVSLENSVKEFQALSSNIIPLPFPALQDK